MAINDVIAHIDAEIARLEQAKALLGGASTAAKSGRGRPKGSKNAKPAIAEKAPATTKRKLSPEGRKAIADAMKKRWAERRRLATK